MIPGYQYGGVEAPARVQHILSIALPFMGTEAGTTSFSSCFIVALTKSGDLHLIGVSVSCRIKAWTNHSL